MTNMLQLHNLTVAFQAKTRIIPAVTSLDLQVAPGETLALLGESGCGKSLTSLAIMRLLPQRAAYGQDSAVYLNNKDLLSLPEKHMRNIRGRRIAMIFQEPMTALNPVLTIGAQLKEAFYQHQPQMKKDISEKLITILREVEIPHPETRLRQYPHQLSGGQKQRIMIAMALACNPDILVADEPTTALDVTIQAQILSLLKRLQQQRKMGMLFITHDLGIAKSIADRVCVMYAGQIVETAKVEDFFKQPLHPYAQQLLVSMPTISQRGKELQTIKGAVPGLDSKPTGCPFHPRCAHAFAPCASIEPLLQEREFGRTVRCHLYPEHSSPPPLPIKETSWGDVVSTSESLLSVQDLTVNFYTGSGWRRANKQITAVTQLSFDLKAGKTLALVGESGCGKTTTARAILRLQDIHGGHIAYKDQNVHLLKGKHLRQFRKDVQVIFQDPFSSMNPRMTVGEILAEGMLAQGYQRKTINNIQKSLLEQVNLPLSSLRRYPHQFSGGQRQRICIARALATKPRVLICDEPTSALDISVQAQILNLLKELQRTHQLSYLFITHNMNVVSYIADDVLVMRGGKAVEFAPCETIFKHPAHPYTKKLLSNVSST